MKRLLLAIIILAAVPLQAAEHRSVVIRIDPASGMALVPDGTPIPEGVNVYGREAKPLAFAHAPEADFTDARAAIARTEPREEDRAPMVVTRDGRAAARPPAFHIRADDSDVTYYLYFVDGSYLSSRRLVIDYGSSGIQYGVQTAVYTPWGNYYNGYLYAQQTSTTYGYDTSAYCLIDSNGGYCSTPTYAVQTTDPNFTAHVVSSGTIHHHYVGDCGQYGEPSCSETFTGSIDIYFP